VLPELWANWEKALSGVLIDGVLSV
jgi:hypothetical protein